jgi:uncharacterized protein YndB with AHSA1/START domain
MPVKHLRFSTRIAAPVEKVWSVMLDPEMYKDWATAFMEGSYFEGSWEQGAKILFLAPGGQGMASVIAENRPHEFVSIRHLGYVSGGVEDTKSEEVRSWAPAYENYTFRAVAGGTELIVDQDVTPEFEQYMIETWPKAFDRLKTLCEQGGGGVRT